MTASTLPSGSHDPVATPFPARPMQDYEYALRRRLASRPDVSGADFLTHLTKTLLQETPSVTAENVMGGLLALAAERLSDRAPSRREFDRLLSETDPEAVRRLLRLLEDYSARRVKAARRAALATAPAADGLSARLRFEAARIPPLMQALTGSVSTIPWDAKEDGHLVSRETARTLGIVRWARHETAERRDRIEEALGRLPAYGERASKLWADRRPLLVIDSLTAYSAKLAGDLWLADPLIGVVLSPTLAARPDAHPIPEGNPFEAFGIPFLIDERAWLRALWGLDRAPLLLEPRLGGFTVTAATGTIDLKAARSRGRFRPDPAPVWMRTLAEMALLTRFDEVARTSGDEALPPVGTRGLWLKRYRALLDFPTVDAFSLARSARYPRAPIEAVKSQREAFLLLRNRVLETLERLARDEAVLLARPNEREADHG